MRRLEMSRKCDLNPKKKPLTGNRVSHAHNKTKMRQLPNLHKKRFFVPSLNRFVTLKVSADTMRTIDKLGIESFAKRQGINLSAF